MTTNMVAPPVAPAASIERRAKAPILVATDGTTQSDGAIATGCALASMLGATVRILMVQPSLRIAVPGRPELADPSFEVKLTADLLSLVRAQCARVAPPGWEAPALEPEILIGEPPRVLGKTAASEGAQLVVAGLGAHDISDRIFGDETTLKLARASSVPVLAVPEHSLTIPRRAVAGIDFSEASVSAAEAALCLLPSGAELHLVHLVPRERQLLEPWMSAREYDRMAQHEFRRLRARLGEHPRITLIETIRAGDGARDLLAYAAEIGADLIVVGSHGHGRVSRAVLGSTTTKVLRGATCAVLMVPPVDRLAPRDGDGRTLTLHIEPSRWADLLDDFTRANRGRKTQLEVDDPEIGAQAQEEDYPLLGVSFDPRDARLQIMLGRGGAGEPHLSRSIGDVRSLHVLSDASGRDLVLRVRHGRGQTILTLAS